MAQYYSIQELMEVTDLSESWIRRVIKKHGINPNHKQGREFYYLAEDIEPIFGQYFTRLYDDSTIGMESQVSEEVVLKRAEYENLIGNLGLLKGKLEELELYRDEYRRERAELRTQIKDLQTEIRQREVELRKLEAEMRKYQRPWWRRWFG